MLPILNYLKFLVVLNNYSFYSSQPDYNNYNSRINEMRKEFFEKSNSIRKKLEMEPNNENLRYVIRSIINFHHRDNKNYDISNKYQYEPR